MFLQRVYGWGLLRDFPGDLGITKELHPPSCTGVGEESLEGVTTPDGFLSPFEAFVAYSVNPAAGRLHWLLKSQCHFQISSPKEENEAIFVQAKCLPPLKLFKQFGHFLLCSQNTASHAHRIS